MYLEFWVVWLVMQLTPLVVTTFSSILYLHKHINRGREVHERGLEILHCYAGGIATLIPPAFSLESFSLCCKSWRLSSLEKRSSRTRSRFRDIRGNLGSKMGLLTIIQIPCHHVLANEIPLNLKYHIGLKHFFNINLGIGIIIFLFVCLFVFLLKFQSRELVGCGIKFPIQRVPTQYTFDGTCYTKTKKYLKKM